MRGKYELITIKPNAKIIDILNEINKQKIKFTISKPVLYENQSIAEKSLKELLFKPRVENKRFKNSDIRFLTSQDIVTSLDLQDGEKPGLVGNFLAVFEDWYCIACDVLIDVSFKDSVLRIIRQYKNYDFYKIKKDKNLIKKHWISVRLKENPISPETVDLLIRLGTYCYLNRDSLEKVYDIICKVENKIITRYSNGSPHMADRIFLFISIMKHHIFRLSDELKKENRYEVVVSDVNTSLKNAAELPGDDLKFSVLRHNAYLKTLIRGEKYNFIRGRELTERHGTKAAMTAIISRNLSHNIGSHVLSYWGQKIEQFLHDRAYNGTPEQIYLKESKELFQYIQHRMDFLATISTSVPCSELPLHVRNDVIGPFIGEGRQSLLMEFIAKSEAIDFNSRINLDIDRNLKSERISIPNGLVGCHAIYAVLENFLRNAAKHYKGKGNSTGIIINIAIREPDNPWKKDYLGVEIWDMRKESCDAKTVEGLREFLPKGKKYGFTHKGELVPGGWGIKEILMCANFLRKNSPDFLLKGYDDREPPLLEILCHDNFSEDLKCKGNKQFCNHGHADYKHRLGIRFYMRKPKDIKVISGTRAIRNSANTFGIDISPSIQYPQGEIPHRILLVPPRVRKHFEANPNAPCRIGTFNEKKLRIVDDAYYLKVYQDFIRSKIHKRQLPLLSYQGILSSGGDGPNGGGFFLNDNFYPEKVPKSLRHYFLIDKNTQQEWFWKRADLKSQSLSSHIVFYYHADKAAESKYLKQLVKKKTYIQPVTGTYSTKGKLESLRKLSDPKLQEQLILELIESAVTKVAILDERVSEWAKGKFNGVSKRTLLKNMNIFIIDIDLEKINLRVISEKIIRIGYVHFFIIHQGVLEKLEKQGGQGDRKVMSVIDKRAAWTVIDSGRGVPINLPGTVRFVEISSLTKVLMEYDKHGLVQILFAARRPNTKPETSL